MASFKFNGVDYLSARFEQLAQFDDDDKLSIIMPAAEFLLQRQIEAIKSVFVQRSGDLAKSLKITKKTDDDGVYAHIAPSGKHSGSSTGKRKGKRGSNGKYSGTNAEVAYILEYGSPRISARHWMETANEDAEDELISIQQDAFDKLLESKGL